MRRTLSALFAVAALAVGAAAQETTPERVETAQSINGTNVRIERTDDARSRTENVDAPAERVWPLVAQVYAELRLPDAAVDSAGRVVAVSGERLRRIGGRSISSYFECGARYGNSASEYDVYVSVSTRVLADGGITRVRTTVSAHARGAGANATTLVCNGNGALEALIAERIRGRLAA
jgi:hypothetical protein